MTTFQSTTNGTPTANPNVINVTGQVPQVLSGSGMPIPGSQVNPVSSTLGLSSPNATTVNNTPVNTTPDASSLNTTKPVVVPPAPQGAAQAANSSIASSQAALLALQGNAQAYQDQRNQELGQTNSLISQYLGKGQDTLDQENALGVPNLRSAAQTANTQYMTSQLAYDTQYQQIMNSPGGTLEQKMGQIQDLQAQAAPGLAQQQISAALNQQQYTNAMDAINNSINLKYQPIKDSIDFGMQFLSQNAGLLSQAQTQQFNAQLQVQQQTYDQGKFYSQLNATTGTDLLKQAAGNNAPQDVINNMTQLIAQGADAGTIASAGAGYTTNGNYSLQFNPNTGNMEPLNANTGKFADGSTPGPNSPSVNPTDPTAVSTTTNSNGSTTNWNAYNGNTDPQYGVKIQASISSINSAVGGAVNSAQTAQQALSLFAPNSPLTGSMIYSTATKAGIDPTALLAQIKQESLCGTSNVAVQNNNCGGVSWTGSAAQLKAGMTQGTAKPASEGGYYAKFATLQDGLNYQANLIKKYTQPPTPNTPGQTQTTQQKIQSWQSVKSALPANLQQAFSWVNATGDSYFDLSKLVNPNGTPDTFAQNQAAQYEKQFGIAALTSSQVQAVQDYDGTLQQVNNLQDAWNAIAPNTVAGSALNRITNPFSKVLQTDYGLGVIKYQSETTTALSALKGQTDSAMIKPFTIDLANSELPKTPSLMSYGDTVKSGNAKLDNIRANLNAQYTKISNLFTNSPLSSQLPNTPMPKPGDTGTVGSGTYTLGADGNYHLNP